MSALRCRAGTSTSNFAKNSLKWNTCCDSRFASSSFGNNFGSSSLNTARHDGSIPITGVPARMSSRNPSSTRWRYFSASPRNP